MKIILLLIVNILLNLVLNSLMLKYSLRIYVWSVLGINLILKYFIYSLNKIGSFRNSISILSLIYLFIYFLNSLLSRECLHYRLNILLLLSKVNTILNLVQRSILVWNLLAVNIGCSPQPRACLYLSNVILHL